MTSEKRALTAVLSKLAGMTCSSLVAGMGVGTAVTLEFGQVVRINSHQTSRGLREFPVYEASIFIQDSTWRIENSSTVICNTAAVDNTEGSVFMAGLTQLLKRRVIEAKSFNTALDLALKFENGLTLLVFSVPTSSESTENYSVFTPDKVITVGFDATVSVSPRDEKQA